MTDEKNNPDQPLILDDRWLDRLVDDELNETNRRRLLCHLDQQPDGWRRCALAFLEAQAWHRAIGSLAAVVSPPTARRQPGAAGTTRGIRAGLPARTLPPRHRFPWYATAVGVLVAFGLGFASQHLFTLLPTGASRQVARSAANQSDSPADHKRMPPASGLAQARQSGTQGRPNGASGRDPLVGVDDESLSPERIVEALRRQGSQIHRRRGVVPFRLEDGRQGFVPIEDLYVVPTKLVTF